MSAQIKNTPDYGTPESVLAAIELMQAPERVRAGNRAKIDNLAQGALPMTPQQQKENQSSVNVNWGEMGKIIREATGIVNNAFLHKDNYATYRLTKGKIEDRTEWSEGVTEDINEIKQGLDNFFRLRNRNGTLVLHGIGAFLWTTGFDWMARFMPLEDLLVPTGSLQGFSNWTNFAANLYLTPSELITMTHSNSKEAAEAGWNLATVRKVLDVYGKLNTNPNNYNWMDKPEEMVQHWRENQAAYDCDSVPKVNLACLYYKSQDGKWYRKIVLKDVQAGDGVAGIEIKDQFVFDSGKRVFAEDITQILHIQYGDCNPVPPYTYHGTRGLGELLFAPVQYLNLLRSQWFHHVMERLMMGLEIDDPDDRDRAKLFTLKPYFVKPRGVRIIPEAERHQVDPRLIDGVMSESRQLLSESSASYVQDVDNGTNREQTLGEAQIKLQNANKIVSVMMDTLYKLETYREKEEFRRLLLPNSSNPDAKKFQEKCKARGIPSELMKPECWKIEIERVAGGGDKTLALQENAMMMQNLPHYDPEAQRVIIRDFTAVVKGDWSKAKMLVPKKKAEVTQGSMAADETFPNLMLGTPVGLREGIEQQDYVGSMMEKLDAVIQRIEATDQMGTPQDVIGLKMVAEDIGQHLQLMAQDQNNKEFVTAVSKELGKQMNLVAAYEQRQGEKNPEQDPEAIAAAQATAEAAQQKLQINEANFQQKQQQSDIKFDQKMRQAEEQQAAKMQQMLDEARLEIESLRAKTVTELQAYRIKTEAEVSALKEKSAAAPAAAD